MVLWKNILIASLLALVAVWVALSFFCPINSGQWKTFQKSLSDQTQALENKVNAIESILADQQLSASGLSGQSSRPPTNPEEIIKSLSSINERLARLEGRLASFVAKKTNIGSVPTITNFPSSPNLSPDPLAWMRELPETKQNQVKEIFKQHQDFMRNKFPKGPPSDLETMKEVFEEGDQILKEKLKTVLSEKEYQKFLDSLPKRPNIQPPKLPISPK